MRGTRPLLITALVTLFLAEGQRAFFASLFALGYQAFFPGFRLGPALVAAAFLLVLLAPLLPLARWVDRRGAVAATAIAAATCRLPMSYPAMETRLVGGVLVLAAGATFLTWAVGYLDRRALTGGVVVGLVVDQLLRVAGSSYDLSLQPGWLPVQAALSLGMVALVLWWARSPGNEPTGGESGDPGLERRAGGLRLRGAMALGALLFLDLHVVGMPPVVARWTGVSYDFAAVALGLAGAAAVAATFLLRRPTGGRTITLLLVAFAAGGAMAGYALDGAPTALLMAGGHTAALVLLTRALDPASGRRGGRTVVAGLTILVLAVSLYALTFYPAFTIPALDGAAQWVFGGVGLLLAACFILLPRPAEIPRPPSRKPTLLLTAGLAVAALVLPSALGGDYERAGAAGAARPAAAAGAPGDGSGAVRVGTWNLHFGFHEDWRFDPGAVAAAIRESDPDLMALQEVPVGMPTAYGIDLPLWLGRRTGLRPYFSATINGLLGDAFLTRLDGAEVSARSLPAGTGDAKQLLQLKAPVGAREVGFNALHLGVVEGARTPQMREALAAIGAGPAVVLGDLNAEAGSPVTALLAEAGFQDVFRDVLHRPATFPTGAPTVRIDWIWVRGLRADSASVLRVPGSDHLPVVATLHTIDGGIRSIEADDLQTP